jgi:hypothetical protein
LSLALDTLLQLLLGVLGLIQAILVTLGVLVAFAVWEGDIELKPRRRRRRGRRDR